MNMYWSDLIKGLTPYVPGEQPTDRRYIKLNTNENPYPPAPAVLKTIHDHINRDLRLYPDPTCSRFRSVAAAHYQVLPENIFPSNGSDEVLAFSFLAFFKGTKPVLYPDVTYSFYPVYSEFFAVPSRNIPLGDGWRIDLDAYPEDNGGVIFPNPNAPTGRLLPVEQVEALLKRNTRSVVLVDEAYIDFGGVSCLPLIKHYPNLLVVQTMSKSRALAGMRIGCAFGHPHLIEGLERVKNCFNSYTLDRLALAAGEAAWGEQNYYEELNQKIIAVREWVSDELDKLDFTVTPSAANFIFISHRKFRAADLFTELRKRGVLVRYFNQPRIENWLRVSIGDQAEMDAFIMALRDILKTGQY